MNYKTYESMTRALVVYEYHYALNYMVKESLIYKFNVYKSSASLEVTRWAWLHRRDFF